MSGWLNYLWVFLGAGVGGGMRYALATRFPPSPRWPLGTLIANLAGCLIIGVLAGLRECGPLQGRAAAWLLLATGVCGGLTTLSSLALELAEFGREREPLAAALYLAASAGGGVLLAAGAWALTRAAFK